MKAPASASALRPASSFAFHRGQARAARQRFAGVAQTHDQRDREPTPGTVAADGDVRRRDFLPAQEPPGSGGILKRRRKLVLRRQAIAHSQGADAGCPARFAHHAPVAGDGAGAIAAAMKEHQDAGSIASRHNRPFAREAPAEIRRFETNVACRRPDCADFIEACAPLYPANRPGPGSKQRTDGPDFRIGHPARH